MVVATAEFISKVVVPRRRDDIVRRQRLVDFLHDHINLRVQCISAPAGYGKTSLLVDFAHDVDMPVCWYSLDASDQDPRSLLEGILTSIRFHYRDFGKVTEARLFNIGDVAAEADYIVGALAGEIYTRIPEYLVLVLEDYHFVENNEAIRKLLDLLLVHAPDNCHIIISSRAPVELPAIPRFVTQGLAARLGTDDLCFTSTEVRQLLAHHNVYLSDDEVGKLATDAEGCSVVLGYQLAFYGICSECQKS